MRDKQTLSGLRVGDMVTVRGRVERYFKTVGGFDEGKGRPAVIVWADDGVIAAPIYTTDETKPALPWEGPPRIGVFADASNRLRSACSQFGIFNAFVLLEKNLGSRFGRLSDEEMEIAKHEFLRIAALDDKE